MLLQQLAEPLQGVVLALDRDQHLVPGDQGVDGEQAQRRRAVDEDVVDLVLVRGDGGAEPVLPGDHRHQLDLGTGQVDGRRHAPQVGRLVDRHGGLRQRGALDQHLVDRRGAAGVLHPEPGARVALRVEVDHQHPQTVQREGDREVHRAGGLADAALLVGDGDHAPVGRAGKGAVAAAVEHPDGLGGLPHDRGVVAVVRRRADGVVQHALDPGPARVQRRGRLVGHRSVLTLVIVPARLRAGGRRAGRRQVDPADRRGPAGWLAAAEPAPANPARSVAGPRSCSSPDASSSCRRAHRTPAHHHDRGGGSTVPTPHRTTSAPPAPSRASTGRAASSSAAAASPLIASSTPPGRSSGSAQPTSRSSGATARAVTTSAPPSSRRTAGSSARPRRTVTFGSRSRSRASVRNAARRASGSSSVTREVRSGERERDPGQAGAAADVDRPGAGRDQLGHHRRVQQVPVPQPGHLPGPEQAAHGAIRRQQLRVRHRAVEGAAEDLGGSRRRRRQLAG